MFIDCWTGPKRRRNLTSEILRTNRQEVGKSAVKALKAEGKWQRRLQVERSIVRVVTGKENDDCVIVNERTVYAYAVLCFMI